MSAVDRVLAKLPKYSQGEGRQWSARCPAHDDRVASLSLGEGKDGRALLKCQAGAGCSPEEIVAKLGLTMADLFEPPIRPRPPARARPTTYVVKDADGQVVVVHERRDRTDGTKVLWWRQPDGTKGLHGRKVETLPLYGSERLPRWDTSRPLVVTEGEKAAHALLGAGIRALGTVTGADLNGKAPARDVLGALAGRDVILWPDADPPGLVHMRTIAHRLAGVAASVRVVDWPGAPKGGDAADAIAVGVDVEQLIARAGPVTFSPPSSQLEACVETYRRWLHLPDPGVVFITLAAIVANRAPGDPLWILLVAPPGAGKTEATNALAGQADVHAVATLTEASLLSGTPKRERADGAKGGLLREIGDFGIVVLKDFGSILSMQREERAKVLAALREVYDGAWTRNVGTEGGRTLSWHGKIGLVAGSTGAIDSHHGVIATMGERFVMYRIPRVDGDAQARAALRHVGRETAMRAELAKAAGAVLSAIDSSLLTAPPGDELVDRLVNLATLAVRCRSAVERDGHTREILLIPEPEAPGRLAGALLRLYNGLCAIGASEMETWRLVTQCALDSMPALRRAVLELLLAGQAANTTAIAETIGYPTQTTRRALEDLTAHGVIVRSAMGPGRADEWAVSTWARTRMPTVPETSGALNGGLEPATVPYPFSSERGRDISGKVPANGHVAGDDLLQKVLDLTGGELLSDPSA